MLLLLFAVAYWGDRRAQAGRSVIGNAWVYALSMAVYCTAWTYFGSVGRAASGLGAAPARTPKGVSSDAMSSAEDFTCPAMRVFRPMNWAT